MSSIERQGYAACSAEILGNFEVAYSRFCELAGKENIPGVYYKAIMLYDGQGVAENMEEACIYMEKVYEISSRCQLDIEFRHLACYQLGMASLQGFGVRRDEDAAVEWWRKAAEEILFDPSRNIGKYRPLGVGMSNVQQLDCRTKVPVKKQPWQ